MERKCSDLKIIDDEVTTSRNIFVDGDALAEELQVQEVILFSGCEEKIIQDSSDGSIDHLIGQNQKQASKRPFMADPEQCSSPFVPTNDEFYCNICMEMVPDTNKFIIHTCLHVFCRSCVSRYVAAKINDNVVYVGWPEPGCRAGAVLPESCRGMIPSELLNKWGFMLCEAALGARRLYCPFRDCSAPLLADDDGEVITDAECPHCHRLFCARCAVPWHDSISCEEFWALGEDERGREDVMVRRLAGEQRWQRCRQCRMYVEKSEGCMLMQCRCGYCFCYACASPMSKELHYCNRCNR